MITKLVPKAVKSWLKAKVKDSAREDRFPYRYYAKYFQGKSEFRTHSRMSRKGYCPVCDCKRLFLAPIDTEDSYNYLRCVVCNSVPRDRAVAIFINEYFIGWRDANLHEFAPSNQCLKLNVRNYSASQYFSEKPLGTMVGDFRNENIEAMTFKDNTFDFIVAKDVVEHVFHPDRMLQEMLRVVKIGGGVIFTTVPNYSIEKSHPRAIIDEKTLKIAELLPPIYHGNPIAKDSLVTWDFGKDFNNRIEKWSGCKLICRSEVDEEHGIIPGGVPFVYILKKKMGWSKPVLHKTQEPTRGE